MAKTTTKLSDLENATKILNDLESKAAELAETRASDERELEAISFEAHGAGDQKALARLETIKARAVKRELDAKSLDAAVAEAKRRVAEAKADEAAAGKHRVALEVRGLLNSLRDAGKVCDETLATFAASSNVMKDIIQKMNALGFHHPSSTQFMSLGERAVRGMLVNTPFQRGFESIAPRERKNFNEFVGQWCISIEREIAQRLGETKQTEKVA
jgi:hypothetical protein